MRRGVTDISLRGKTIAVVGYNARPIAGSLKKLGARVLVSDYWGDADLSSCSDNWIAVLSPTTSERQRRPIGKPLHLVLVDNMLHLAGDSCAVDHTIFGSGFDDHPEALRPLRRLGPLAGNDADTIRRSRNRTTITDLLEDTPVCLPYTAEVSKYDINDSYLKLPLILRPKTSGGGSGIRLIGSESALMTALERLDNPSEYLVQQYVSGLDVSCSVLSDDENCFVLSIQGQLIGMPSAGLGCTFAYCGNYLPLRITAESRRAIESVVTSLSSALGLVGSNGFDFVVGKDEQVYLMEINPRLQGSLELLELTSSISVTKLHLEALQRKLPRSKISFRPGVKMIVYSPRDGTVEGIGKMSEAADVTPDGVGVKKGDPVCTVLQAGRSLEDSYGGAIRSAATIRDLVR